MIFLVALNIKRTSCRLHTNLIFLKYETSNSLIVKKKKKKKKGLISNNIRSLNTECKVCEKFKLDI